MLKRTLLGIVGVFVLIQLIPVWLGQTNPPVTQEPEWDSPQTQALAQRSCYNCHSNETNWPLYSRQGMPICRPLIVAHHANK